MFSRFRRDRRTILTVAVASMMLALSWWRTDVPQKAPEYLELRAIDHELNAPLPEGWSLDRVWEIDNPSLHFGGFSAITAAWPDTLHAWSDRGWRLGFEVPEDRPGSQRVIGGLSRQSIAEGYGGKLWDIESATLDPLTGHVWLGFEFTHAIQREHNAYDTREKDVVRILEGEVDWPANSGAEALVRLHDGRFLAFGETAGEMLVFEGDPVEGSEFVRHRVEWPREGFAVTDAAQLPDGRVIMLMRKLSWGLPPFSGLMVVADPMRLETDQPWRPEVIFVLEDVLPRENYEGIFVQPRPDGAADVWLISDDNFSAFQRTLLARMVYSPEE